MTTLYDALELVGRRVLVRPISTPKVSAGGIIMPEMTEEQFHRGIVEKVGTELDLDGLVGVPRVGDLVLYHRYGGTWVEFGGKARLLLVADPEHGEIHGIVRAKDVELVSHPDLMPPVEHLVGERCEACAQPEQEAAKERLAEMRRAFQGPRVLNSDMLTEVD